MEKFLKIIKTPKKNFRTDKSLLLKIFTYEEPHDNGNNEH